MRIGIIKDNYRIDSLSEDLLRQKEKEQEKVARAMEEALSEYDVIDYIFDEHLGDRLKEDKIDLVLNLAKGNLDPNDDGELPSLLNSLDIAYAGSNAMGMGIASDVSLLTAILTRNDIPHPKMGVAENPVALSGLSVEYPSVVMNNSSDLLDSREEGSLVVSGEELFEEATPRFAKGEELLVMESLEGQDVLVAVLGNGDEKEVLPPLALVEAPERGEGIYAAPADLKDTPVNEAKAVAAKVFDLLQLRDYGIIAMRVNDKKVYVYGVDSALDFHPDGPLAAAAKEEGKSYDELIQKIVDIAVKREGLKNDGKKGDVEALRTKRHKEQEEARKKAREDYRNRMKQEAKRSIDDFQDEAKRKSAEYKAKASREADRFKDNAQSAMDSAEAKAYEWRDRASDAMDDAEAKAYELRDRAEDQAYKMRDGAETAAQNTRDKAEEFKRRAAQKKDDTVDYLVRYAEEAEEAERRENDAPEVNDNAVYGAVSGGSVDAHYRALERRVHALEERLRLLENR